jgi:hypothetical protein
LSDVTKQYYLPIGTVDYSTGLISLTSLNVIDFVSGEGIEVMAHLNKEDISAVNNDLIEIDMASLQINVNTL